MLRATALVHPAKNPVKGCEAVCCSGFVRKEGLISLQEPNLTGNIHPLLSEKNFYHDVDYGVLDQALRMLSNMLEVSLPFYFTIFFSNLRHIQGLNDNKRSYDFYSEPQELTWEQKEKTRRALEIMSEYVMIEVGKGSSTAPTGKEHKNAFFLRECRVRIDQEVYDAVVEASKPNADPVQRFTAHFRLRKRSRP